MMELTLIFQSPVTLMGDLYQTQGSSPVTSRVHQAYSAVTGFMGYCPKYDSPVDVMSQVSVLHGAVTYK